VLDPGGGITGTVTSSATGLPIAGVRVNFVNSDGGANGTVKFTSGLTDALGHYTSDGGTATGNVFAFTTNDRGYQDDVYNQVHCPNCDVTTLGTLIPVTLGSTTANINFALDLGGSIAGTGTNVSATPLAGIEVDIADSTRNTVDHALGHGNSGDRWGDHAGKELRAVARRDHYRDEWSARSTRRTPPRSPTSRCRPAVQSPGLSLTR
jgi:hypothetical protein